jgi:ABC-2 type transport system permease protein
MISGRKVNALVGKQLKTITGNPFVITPILLVPFMAFLFSTAFDAETAQGMIPFIVGMNMIMGAPTVISCLIAEEKEKNTLSVLITSTVSVLDFLTSKILIASVSTILLNIAIYFLMGAQTIISFGIFMLFTSLGALASTLLGAVIGIASKNQATASTMVSPLMLLLIMPVFFPDNFFVDNILYYFFTEQVLLSIHNMAFNDGTLEAFPLIIIAANIVIFGALFGIFYKKKGLGME